ncbi:hypothetical protein GCK72_005194 [Caenorhabditis remanei]|uniref:Uncharacterized protein n=1 Tax=Caenorhabditis remanei TaxID=31234 RepID=A0A6A5HGJ5_CAERE|nr:hypothetical protein GCK72_005194 [Caenorhabditis remanei]KAF1765242.1 hypothetical protein GCK72_005194 [Caenorhabditis remanei]
MDESMLVHDELGEHNTIIANSPGVDKTGIYVDLVEHFGIVCEDSKWIITKYPYGYLYENENMDSIHVDSSELSCKTYKTEIKRFYW